MTEIIANERSYSEGESALIEKGAAEGFYRNLDHKHSVLFSRRSGTLLVTFENLEARMLNGS